jgi:hypothetical protein
MRYRVNGAGGAFALLGLACALPLAASAARPDDDGPDWVPALAAFGDVVTSRAEIAPESGGELQLASVGGSPEGLITPLVLEEETGLWVPVLILPREALAESADDDAAPASSSGDALIAIPVAIAVTASGPATSDDSSVSLSAPSGSEADGLESIFVAQAGREDASVEIVEPIAEAETADPTPDAGPRDEVTRWVPALAIVTGALIQHGDGSSETTEFENLSGAIEPVRPSVVGENDLVPPFVGGSLELMTPGLTSWPARPRLFLHGDAAAAFSASYSVAREGAPGELIVPPNVRNEQLVQGQGSDARVEVKPLVVSAGLGVAFTVDAWERRLRIKPSFEYLRETIELTGVVDRAANTFDGQNRSVTLIRMSGSAEETYHGIGPGLELEMDTVRTGPLMLTLFLSGQAYRFLGHRPIVATDSFEIDDQELGQQTVNARWTFDKDAWGGRVALGLRFRWLPE